MNIEKILRTETILLTEIDRLDPISIYIENIDYTSAKVTVTCFGRAWHAYWGGCDGDAKEFMSGCDVDYIANCMWDHRNNQNPIDWDKVGEMVGESDICENSWFYYLDKITDSELELHDLPTKTCDDYLYLKRIVNAVIEWAKTDNN